MQSQPTQPTRQKNMDFPLCDVTYDLISLIHEKSQGLEVLQQYERDAGNNREVADLFKRTLENDRQAITDLTDKLRCLLNEAYKECRSKKELEHLNQPTNCSWNEKTESEAEA